MSLQDNNNLMKYSGIGFQIAAITGVGALIGYFLDKKFSPGNPYFLAGGAILFLFLALFIAFRGLLKEK
jgi:F0F1-type ATP synthase assembly protein I